MLNLLISDSHTGCNAKSVQFEISYNEAGEWRLVGEGVTDSEGAAKTIVDQTSFRPGYYELTLFLGEYFRAKDYALPGRKFVDIVPIRFGVENIEDELNIIVIVGPFGYSVSRAIA